VAALLAQGQIYENDLHDAASAKERYALLLKQFPRSAQAEEAKAGIGGLDGVKTAKGSERQPVTAKGSGAVAAADAGASTLGAMPVTRDPNAVGLVAKSSVELGDVTAHLDDKIDKGMDRRGTAAPVDDVVDESAPAVVKSAGRAKRRGELAKVTGIRHWSTPTYTRVAIDLGMTSRMRLPGFRILTGFILICMARSWLGSWWGRVLR